MKSYEYQILRYIPDQISSEFLNVGIVMYSSVDRNLCYEFVNSKQRITATFQGIEASHIIRKIKELQTSLEQLEKKFNSQLELNDFSDVKQFTQRILQKDDSAIQFSEVKKGIDLDLKSAFYDLKERLLYKWIRDRDDDYLSDEDVWREKYRQHFERKGITKKLVPHSIITKSDELKFDLAYKNGMWNCFQPINLNLKKTDSIKNKVYRWKGVISELQTAEENLKLVFLSELPEKEKGMTKFIQDQLVSQINNKITTELITQADIDELLQNFQIS